MLKKTSLAAFAALLTTGALAGQAQARIDFDRDGKSDILWHNGETGEIRIWRMNGTTRLEDLGTTYMGGLSSVPNSSGWRVGGVNDFNKDGVPDILWHNGTSGQVLIWYMGGTKGTNAVSYLDVTGTGAGPVPDSSGWRIVGTGDLNADGHPDILWANRDGTIVTWLLGGAQGNTSLNGLVLNGFSMPEKTLTRAVGLTDFNGDGVPDILWHNASTGRLSIWFLNAGASNASTAPSLQGTLDLSVATFGNNDSTFYRFAGTEDMNGDGMPDLMWHHQINGDTKYQKLSVGLGSLGTDAMASNLNVADNTGWRIVNGTQQPRPWRRGANCVPYDTSMQSKVVSSGMSIQLTGVGTKVICPVPKTTSGPNIANDNLVAVDMNTTVPSSQPQLVCRLNEFKTTSLNLSGSNWVGTPGIDNTVGTGGINIHMTPAAHTGWWRANDWDYAQMTCEVVSGSGTISINQYWMSEDGTAQKQRIYPASVCYPDAALWSIWGFQEGSPGGSAGGFVESFTNGNNSTNPPGGLFQWDCGRTLGSLNDTNKTIDINFLPNMNGPWTINSAATGQAYTMAPANNQIGQMGTYFSQQISTVSHEFNVKSSGYGDTVLFSYRTR